MKNKLLQSALLLCLAAAALLTGCGGGTGVTRSANEPLDKRLTETVFSDIRVLQKQTQREKAVAVEIIFTGGVQTYSPNLDGVEALALLAVLNGSSTEMLHTEIQSKLRALGAVVDYRVGWDYSSITLQTTEKNFASAWQLLMQQVLYPAFDSTEFNTIKADYIELLKEAEAQPHVAEVQTSLQKLLGDHPYIRMPQGTAANVAEIPLDTVQAHYGRMAWKNRIALASAGSMNPLKVQRELIGTLTMLQVDKKYVQPVLQPLKTALVIKPVFEAGNMEGGIVRGLFDAPPPTTREGAAAAVALHLFVNKLEDELCSKRRIACGVVGELALHQQSFGTFYFATEVPNPSILAMKEVLKSILVNGFSQQDVNEQRDLMLTRYYAGLQTSKGQASQLGLALALGNWQQKLGYATHLASLTPAEVNNAAKKYFAQFCWAFVGNTGKVGRGAFDVK